jgi:hypothetical protein
MRNAGYQPLIEDAFRRASIDAWFTSERYDSGFRRRKGRSRRAPTRIPEAAHEDNRNRPSRCQKAPRG